MKIEEESLSDDSSKASYREKERQKIRLRMDPTNGKLNRTIPLLTTGTREDGEEREGGEERGWEGKKEETTSLGNGGRFILSFRVG